MNDAVRRQSKLCKCFFFFLCYCCCSFAHLLNSSVCRINLVEWYLMNATIGFNISMANHCWGLNVLGEESTAHLRSYHSQIHFALSGHKYHRLFIYSKRTLFDAEECCLFPIQLPSNMFVRMQPTAYHSTHSTHTQFFFFGVKESSSCFPIVAGNIEI